VSPILRYVSYCTFVPLVAARAHDFSSLVVFIPVLIHFTANNIIATKSKVHNTSDDALFQNVGLFAQSLAILIDNRDVTHPGYVSIIYAVL